MSRLLRAAAGLVESSLVDPMALLPPGGRLGTSLMMSLSLAVTGAFSPHHHVPALGIHALHDTRCVPFSGAPYVTPSTVYVMRYTDPAWALDGTLVNPSYGHCCCCTPTESRLTFSHVVRAR
jgi:hypothetical protein